MSESLDHLLHRNKTNIFHLWVIQKHHSWCDSAVVEQM